jgi:hypothetical protein
MGILSGITKLIAKVAPTFAKQTATQKVLSVAASVTSPPTMKTSTAALQSNMSKVSSTISKTASSVGNIVKNAYVTSFTKAPLKTTAYTGVAAITGLTVLKSSSAQKAILNTP